MNRLSNIDKIALFVIILFSVMLFVFGYLYHPVPDPLYSEVDRYIDFANRIRSGILPRDEFRPLFYPIITAFFGNIFNDTFIAGRFVSQISAVTLLIITYLLAKKVFNEILAIVTLVVLSINFNVFLNGVSAGTDMIFTAFTLITMYLLSRLIEKFSLIRLILLALFFSLSYFTRYTAIILIPVVITGVIFFSPKSLMVKIKNILIFLISSFFFLLPHFLITLKLFGKLFYDENWKNIAFKLYGNADWEYLNLNNGNIVFNGDWSYFWNENMQFNGLYDVIFNSPKLFFLSGMKELTQHFIIQCGLLSKILYVNWYFFSFLFLIGLIIWCLKLIKSKSFLKTPKSKSIFLILLFVISYAILISFTFFTFERIIFVILPFIYYFIFYAVYSLFNLKIIKKKRFFKKIDSIQKKVIILIVLLCLLLQFYLFYKEIIEHYDNLPLKEFNAAKELQKKYGKEINVLYTTYFLERYVDYNCMYWCDLKYKKDIDLFFQQMNREINEHNLNFLIIGKSNFDYILNLIISDYSIPDFLELKELSNKYVIFKVKKN